MIDCILCPEGTYCDTTGIADLTERVCPIGFYCTEGTVSPHACPPGTYYNITGAESEDDCKYCPEGYFCPEGTG